MSQVERFRHINAMNMILARAEHDIHLQTGVKVRLIMTPVTIIDNDQNPQGLLDVIAQALGKMPTDYWVISKKTEYVHLKMLGAYFLRTYYPGLTLAKIGEMLCGTDHSMVSYYLTKTREAFDAANSDFMNKHDKALTVVTQWLATDI